MNNNPSHPHQKVHAFLRHHPMGILSTVSSDGRPWGSAIYYTADQDFNFYFVTRTGTLKYQNLEEIPHVSLTVADSSTQTTVQIAGEISKLPVKDYMNFLFDKLAGIRPKGDHAWAPPLEKIHNGNYQAFKLTPTKLQYADYSHTKANPKTNYIEAII